MLRILIVGPSWVGDMVIAHGAVQYLRQRYPDCHIDILAPKAVLAVASRMVEVNRTICSPFAHGQLAVGQRRRLAATLRGHYDWALVLPTTFKSALVPYWAGIEKRTGFIGECRYGVLNDRYRLTRALLTMQARYLTLAAGSEWHKALFVPKLRVDAVQTASLRDRFAVAHRHYAVLAPGAAYGPAKRWPAAYCTAVVAQLIERGLTPLIVGGEAERPLAEAIIAGTGDATVSACGQTTLAEVIDLLAEATVFIGNDSGLMHIAAAVGVPVVTVYGSSTPLHTPPLVNEPQRARVVQSELRLRCRPCFARTCRYGHYACLHTVTPLAVAEAVSAVSQ